MCENKTIGLRRYSVKSIPDGSSLWPSRAICAVLATTPTSRSPSDSMPPVKKRCMVAVPLGVCGGSGRHELHGFIRIANDASSERFEASGTGVKFPVAKAGVQFDDDVA